MSDDEPQHEPPGCDAETLAIARERAAQARLWLRVLTPIVQHYDHDPERPEAVQQALDTTLIAACARIRRLIRSDLGEGDAT